MYCTLTEMASMSQTLPKVRPLMKVSFTKKVASGLQYCVHSIIVRKLHEIG